MEKTTLAQSTLPLSRLNRAVDHPISLEPDAEARAELAAALDLTSLRKLRLSGVLVAEGARDWRLSAQLGATVLQPCAVTLAPVTTRIDQSLTRQYRADLPVPEADEIEMPEDDSIEALPASLDLMEVLTEALALAVPDYPRAQGVELGEAVFAAPGVAPMRDEDARPLAGLAALRDKLAAGEDDSDKDDR